MINCSSNLTMGKWYRATRSRLVLLPPLKQLLYPSLSRAGNLGHLTWVRHSNCKSSATHSCHCVQHQFHLSRQRYGCHCVQHQFHLSRQRYGCHCEQHQFHLSRQRYGCLCAKHQFHLSRQRYGCHCVQDQFHLSRQRYGCQCVGFLTCMQMLMHAIAHMSCMVTIRESALKIDPGREIPFRMGDSVPCQYCLLPGFSVGCSAN